MSRPFAVFDIDGTIIRWQLYHAIGDRLAKQGLLKESEFARVRRARMNWKKRTGDDSFDDYETTLIEVFDAALTGIKTSDFKQAVGAVFDEYKEQVYTYTRDLIEDLRAKDYLLFALSGSPDMIVGLFAQFYGFDDFAGTLYKVKDGRFTSHKELTVGRKPELLKQLVKKHNLSFKNSIGIGDSEGDLGMLELTEQPIAFNPTRRLFNHARRHGWKIVVERKNMVYELEAENGNYGLRV